MFTGLASPTHLLILLVIILLLFGAKRLPELGRSLGQGLQELKEGLNTKVEPKETEEQKHPEGIEEEKGKATMQG
jgi:sec-independent protein translocase protein TatA